MCAFQDYDVKSLSWLLMIDLGIPWSPKILLRDRCAE